MLTKIVKNHTFSDIVTNFGATRFFRENPAVLHFLVTNFVPKI